MRWGSRSCGRLAWWTDERTGNLTGAAWPTLDGLCGCTDEMKALPERRPAPQKGHDLGLCGLGPQYFCAGTVWCPARWRWLLKQSADTAGADLQNYIQASFNPQFCSCTRAPPGPRAFFTAHEQRVRERAIRESCWHRPHQSAGHVYTLEDIHSFIIENHTISKPHSTKNTTLQSKRHEHPKKQNTRRNPNLC